MDREFLRKHAFGPIKEATEFMNAFMRRPDAHGPASPWQDDKFHIHPTQSPEIWRKHFGEPEFSDALPDLTLTKFLFNAYLSACRELGLEPQERTLMNEVQEILANFPDYVTKDSPRGGKVFVDVADATPDAIYNTPSTLMPVFPGEEIGLHSPKELYELAANTWRNQQNEGGNELVFIPAQGARLGLLDLEKFKRELRYDQMPDGTFTDMLLEAGGRNEDTTPEDLVKFYGIWVENFAIPLVINECLLQSYTGELRFFPNWSRANGNARFQTLRAVGAFLVSAEYRDGKVHWIRVISEAGQRLHIINPWRTKALVSRNGTRNVLSGPHIELLTHIGETLEFIEA
jgi:alpha-L-fucosidase 2